MKKLIVFILAAVLVSCSQQELKRIEENKKLSKQYEVEKTSKSYKVTYSYERSLDTIKVSETYVIVAVYRCRNSVSGVVVGTLTGLNQYDSKDYRSKFFYIGNTSFYIGNTSYHI